MKYYRFKLFLFLVGLTLTGCTDFENLDGYTDIYISEKGKDVVIFPRDSNLQDVNRHKINKSKKPGTIRQRHHHWQ